MVNGKVMVDIAIYFLLGLAVISKSIVADICDDTNMSLGIAIVLSAFSTGLLLGPSLGG